MRGPAVHGAVDDDLARAIGLAFGTLVDESSVAVGRDARRSSPHLVAALTNGLAASGVDVVDLGPVTTDVVYHASADLGCAGVMVTASHNPSGDNGFKFCRSGARPVAEGTGLEAVRALVLDPPAPAAVPGTRRSHDGIGSYVDHLCSIVDPASIAPMRVAVDGAGGVAGLLVSPLADRFGLVVDGIHLDPDGPTSGRPPDPTRPEHLVDLTGVVRQRGADVGVAFDGDGDRAVFVDEHGVPLGGSTTTALLARWFLARHPGAAVVHNVICSRAVPEVVVAAGGRPVRTRVGHSYIKAVMAETGAVFGGEHSGHFYVAENHRADSGALALLLLLRVLTEAGRPLSEVRREVEPYAQSGELNQRVDDVGRVLAAVRDAFPGAGFDELDGLTVDLGDAWFNLRPSNTETLLRLNVEAPDPAGVAALVDRVRSIINDAA